jgi:hypothetical protein
LLLQGSGIVDQASDSAELRLGEFEQPDHGVFIRHIGLETRGTAAESGDFIPDPLSRGPVSQVVDHHLPSLAGGQYCGSSPYTPAGTGNDYGSGFLVGSIYVHFYQLRHTITVTHTEKQFITHS